MAAPGIPAALHAAVQGDAGVVFPEVLLRGQDLEGAALRLPDVVDVEDHVRLVVALLGLVRLEQEHRRRVVGEVGVRLVPGRLGDDAGLLREARRLGMIHVVGVLQRMGEHEGRLQLAVDVDEPVEHLRRGAQRIVARVEELDLRAQHRGGALRLRRAAAPSPRPAIRRAFFQAHWLSPRSPIGEADDLHAVALLGMKRDGAARPPDEVAGMGGDDKSGLSSSHKGLKENVVQTI